MKSTIAQSIIDVSPLPRASDNVIEVVVNWVFALTAAIGVLIIIIAGIRFMTARGDPQTVAKARSTILYVAVGLIVMSLAYAIVRVTLSVLED